MLIFDEYMHPIIIDSINSPIISEHFWVLDLEMVDYTLTPIQMLEEIECPSVILRILGFEFCVPAYWNILIFDEETGQLDTVKAGEAAGSNFSAVIFGSDMSMIKAGNIAIVNYAPVLKNVCPSLNKHQMLCHPISQTAWINVSPADVYNKYLKDLSVGELI